MKPKEDKKKEKRNRNHRVEMALKCHRNVSYYRCDTLKLHGPLNKMAEQSGLIGACTSSKSVVSG